MTHEHYLRGLDAQNPLGYFAALGTFRVVDDLAVEAGTTRPTLRFCDEGRQVPVLRCHLDQDALLEALVADARSDRGLAALSLQYGDDGEPCDDPKTKPKRDLKPSPAYAKAYLEGLARSPDRRAADLGLAFLSELAQDNNGKTKPTSFHFAAGQQQWLDMVLDLRAELTHEHVREALLGPWVEHGLPSLAWDSSVARLYALRATDPSSEKRGSVPGAYWLGVIGLTFFPVVPHKERLETTCVEGGWKDSTFTWPLWDRELGLSTARSLIRADVKELSGTERSLLGMSLVFASRIERTDQGGYGSFTPADAVGPKRRRK